MSTVRVGNGNIKMKYFTFNSSALGDETEMRYQTTAVNETCMVGLNSYLKLMVPSNAVTAAKSYACPPFTAF